MTNWAAAVTLFVLLAGSAEVFAQSEPQARFTLQAATKLGDTLTITTTDGMEVKGRLLRLDAGGLVVDTGAGAASATYERIERVRRRKNGITAGAVTGVLAGLWLGSVAEHEVGSATTGFDIVAVSAVLGTGIGIGIDALIGTNRTIFRRSTSKKALRFEPRKGGAAVGWSAAW